MTSKFIFVDYENRPLKELPPSLPDGIKLVIFLGPQNKNLPTPLVLAIGKLKEQVDLKLLDKGGANALDFVMCFELGRLSKEHAEASFALVTGDTGFQPLVNYCNAHAVKISRFDSLDSALATPLLVKQNSPTPVAAAKTVAKPSKNAVSISSSAAEQKKALAAQVTLSGQVNAVREKLDGMRSARPKSLKSLTVKVQEFCGAKTGKTKVDAVIKRLESSRYLVISGTKVSYEE